jgi:hypothetical protein
MRFDSERSTIAETGVSEYLLRLYVQADNNDSALPEGFRRWWHLRIDGLKCQSQACEV